MRRLPLLVSGLLALPLAVLPVAGAAAGDAVEEPTPSVTASATAEPEPTLTEEPQPGPEDPEFPEVLTGDLTRSPASGPAGTAVKVASKDACVDGAGQVGPVADVLALNLGNLDDVTDLAGLTDLARLAAADEDDLDFGFVEEVVATDDDGAWATTLTIPAVSEPGDVYMIIAACFADQDEVTDPDAFPFLIYEPLDFSVTGAPEAPVAEPVPGDPSFTG